MSPEKGFVSYVDSDYLLRYHWVFTLFVDEECVYESVLTGLVGLFRGRLWFVR